MHLLASLLALLQVAPPAAPPPTPAQIDDVGEIVVTARKGAPPPLEAVAYYRRHCFDAYRLTGEAKPPVDDPDWQELDPEEGRRFGATDAEPAFALRDETRGRTLLLKFATVAHRGGIEEKRCTLVIVGGTGHDRLPAQVSAVFAGEGAQTHVGHDLGTPAIAGWRQRLWTGMPARGSTRWQSINADRKEATARFLTVTDLGFYDRHDFIVGDLKTRTDGPPASVLTFSLYRRRSR